MAARRHECHPVAAARCQSGGRLPRPGLIAQSSGPGQLPVTGGAGRSAAIGPWSCAVCSPVTGVGGRSSPREVSGTSPRTWRNRATPPYKTGLAEIAAPSARGRPEGQPQQHAAAAGPQGGRVANQGPGKTALIAHALRDDGRPWTNSVAHPSSYATRGAGDLLAYFIIGFPFRPGRGHCNSRRPPEQPGRAQHVHRRQLTFDCLDTVTGEVQWGRVVPADREHLRAWLARFAGQDDVHVERRTPLLPLTRDVVRNWITERQGAAADPLFPTSTGRRLSRDAVERRVAHYVAKASSSCPSLGSKHVTAHTLRAYRGDATPRGGQRHHHLHTRRHEPQGARHPPHPANRAARDGPAGRP